MTTSGAMIFGFAPLTTAAESSATEPRMTTASGARVTPTTDRKDYDPVRDRAGRRAVPCCCTGDAAILTAAARGRRFSSTNARPNVALRTASRITIGSVFFRGRKTFGIVAD